MKRLFKNSVIVILLFWIAIYFSSCMKEATLPVVKTNAVSNITQTTALVEGTVTDDGGAKITDIGVCWSTSPNPTISSNKAHNGYITGLTANTTYYLRAFATNSAGTSYGNEVIFKTEDIIIAQAGPTLTTTTVTSITFTSAVSGGAITNDGGEDIIYMGVCWSTSPGPEIFSDNVKAVGIGSAPFVSYLSGLNPGTTYYVRAYAFYGIGGDPGVVYGNEVTFSTPFRDPLGQKAIFPGGPRYYAASFSIGTKVYLGLGYNDDGWPLSDIWEWNQATNIWTKKADFPGNSTGGSVCFSIGTKGYIGTENVSINGSATEFWEYDPGTDNWTQKASLPTTPARALAVGFSIGTKGYIGLGTRDSYAVGGNPGFYKDFWEWDQATNVWTKKADFGGAARYGAVGFSVGNKGYIGTGYDGISYLKDFWEWDQATDVWTNKADFGGNARVYAVGFSIGDKGYIGTGFNGGSITSSYKDIWEWDQKTNVWIKKADFDGDARNSAVGVSIGNKGYIGTGFGGDPYGYLNDFWEYDLNYH